MGAFQDLTGKRFGRLVAVEYKGKRKWLFKCDCGKEVITYSYSAKSGNTSSCGCLAREISAQNCKKLSYKHGLTNHPLFQTWTSMKERCNNPNNRNFKHYGGRGIGYCDEWKVFENFYEWAINNGYEKGLSIDRVDFNGNYEPSNCRWIPMAEQAANKRNTVLITYDGITKPAQQWSFESGYSRGFLSGKVRGKSETERNEIAGYYIRKACEGMLKEGVLGDWISVEEKLPANGTRVLVCGTHGQMDVCRFDDMDGSTRFVTHESQHLNVAYWMPLPKVPHKNGGTYKTKM